ncbi:MAG: glycosyltransferase family 2 protein [Candidatus Magasanikbacteria bacterium CG_4_10_14_0_2_um_filter_37_12]|uniref:Glycosyltransferase family 2 protein n=1 Tax=Candidatus Magasanikbacteria bacterium CG_4_10_14_0_2_um_filter_37_12 TaxID=1974637 RepID=A0A2M7V8D3_9BACT|nr:MAG: glycosyltransferase family 2 protein [Candidatus Magasanikbacteria bacterium CG_4_10_14_0_2_um_filter_37_12]
MFLAIVPAYNEEKRIGSVVQSLFEHVDKVLVVDDCSEDNTFEESKKAGAVVLHHKINCGQGAALETGHEYARRNKAEYVLHFDGDGQFDTNDIIPALQKIKEKKADVLLGSRFLDNRSKIPWFKKYILLPVAQQVGRVFGGLKLTDAHNGFRILNINALKKIRITQDRMAHASQIPELIQKYNLNYVEFPVKVTYHEYGQCTVGGLRIMRDLIIGKFIK